VIVWVVELLYGGDWDDDDARSLELPVPVVELTEEAVELIRVAPVDVDDPEEIVGLIAVPFVVVAVGGPEYEPLDEDERLTPELKDKVVPPDSVILDAVSVIPMLLVLVQTHSVVVQSGGAE
jgi:hypothetical protein